MIGSTPAERARVRELERIADLEVLLPVARIVHATRSPLGLPPSPEVAAYNRTRLDRSLPELERVLADGRPFLAGDRPTIADGTLLAGLNFGLAFSVEPDPELRHLARWQERCRARPAAKVLARAR